MRLTKYTFIFKGEERWAGGSFGLWLVSLFRSTRVAQSLVGYAVSEFWRVYYLSCRRMNGSTVTVIHVRSELKDRRQWGTLEDRSTAGRRLK